MTPHERRAVEGLFRAAFEAGHRLGWYAAGRRVVPDAAPPAFKEWRAGIHETEYEAIMSAAAEAPVTYVCTVCNVSVLPDLLPDHDALHASLCQDQPAHASARDTGP